MTGRRDGGSMLMMRNNSPQTLRWSKILIAITIGVAIGCVFAPCSLRDCSLPPPLLLLHSRIVSLVKSCSHPAAGSSSCESSELLSLLKSEYASVSQKNAEMRKEIRELTEKFTFVEQEYDNAQKQVLSLGKQAKAGPFGTGKGSRINPTVIPMNP